LASQLLAGLNVLDLSLWQPGHYATQLLADLGADVLKIEPPGGDRMRVLPDRFVNYNGHKRSLVIDLKDPSDRARLMEQVARAEVVVEGYRPGVADRLGVGYEQLRSVNAALVYCSISGFGQTGPLAHSTGHDFNYQAYAGALVSSETGGLPVASQALIGDQGGGMAAAFAILAAVLNARRTGSGERIDVSIADLILTWVAPHGRIDEEDEAASAFPGSATTATYETADGGHVVLGIFSEDHFWKALCAHFDLGEIATLGMEERSARAAELQTVLQEVFARRRRDEVVAELDALGIPVAPVLSRVEALRHPHFWERGVLTRDEDGERRIGHPIRFQEHPSRAAGNAPALGEGGEVDFPLERKPSS
jgi:crotonobetainyl-CoA:carnitine CoA-transferase CaiB-like acyl-CoA transferase